VIREFRDFVNRGNVVELAVAFVMGVAFNPIVQALVDRVLMPLVGAVFGEPNFDRFGTFGCGPDVDPAAGVVVGDRVCTGSVGAVVTATVNFLLVALALFFVVRAYNRFKARAAEPTAAAPPAAEPEDVVLLREIRDLLARR
jgi:large conductance mechanosensitive channel